MTYLNLSRQSQIGIRFTYTSSRIQSWQINRPNKKSKVLLPSQKYPNNPKSVTRLTVCENASLIPSTRHRNHVSNSIHRIESISPGRPTSALICGRSLLTSFIICGRVLVRMAVLFRNYARKWEWILLGWVTIYIVVLFVFVTTEVYF